MSYSYMKKQRNKTKKSKQMNKKETNTHTADLVQMQAIRSKPYITSVWFITIKHGTVKLFQRLSWRGAFNRSCFEAKAVRAPQGTELGGCQCRILLRPVSACP